MGRVETRMYKRRRTRQRRILLILVIVAGILAAWKAIPADFISEHISLPSPTPMTSGYDQTMESREITLAQESWYAIQTGVFSTREAAQQKSEAYTSRGAPGSVIREGEKWRVFIACYGTEANAAAVRSRLENNQKVDTYLYVWQCPEVRLRLTGKAGQLDAVEAGFTLMMTAASSLRDAAIDLDAGQLTKQEVADAITALGESIALWEKTVRDRFGKSLPELVRSMQTVIGTWPERQLSIAEAGDASTLSADLKAQAMELYDDIIAWRKTLLAQ